MKLMIGTTLGREGWQTLDAKPGADFVATIPPLPAEVKAIDWEEIEWIHGITSLYPWEAADVLSEIRHIMVPGGVLILEQPNAAHCNAATDPQWVFGDPQFRDPLHMNKWTYTPESLIALCTRCGFSRGMVFPAQHHVSHRDFRLEVVA